jgi:hypothetical protein
LDACESDAQTDEIFAEKTHKKQQPPTQPEHAHDTNCESEIKHEPP